MASAPAAIEAWTETVAKLREIVAEGERCLDAGDYLAANVAFHKLREYGLCSYCTRFRGSLTMRSVPGGCAECPIHLYAQRLAGRALDYNGCYRIPEYEDMVRASMAFGRSPSLALGRHTLEAIRAVMDRMERDKAELV